jgi:hypothetical protein
MLEFQQLRIYLVTTTSKLARQASVRPHVGHRYHASNGRSYDQGRNVALRLMCNGQDHCPVREVFSPIVPLEWELGTMVPSYEPSAIGRKNASQRWATGRE